MLTGRQALTVAVTAVIVLLGAAAVLVGSRSGDDPSPSGSTSTTTDPCADDPEMCGVDTGGVGDRPCTDDDPMCGEISPEDEDPVDIVGEPCEGELCGDIEIEGDTENDGVAGA